MKYNITINQKAVIDNELIGKLDIIDLAIFDFVYHFFNSDFDDKVTFTKNGVEYTEIRPSLLEREMPLLKIGTKRTFINRMNNLINAGLIERYENNSNENRSGYKKGVNFSIFEFDKPKKQDSQGCENNFTPPMKTDSHNNNINDNRITDNNKEEIDKSISKKDTKTRKKYDEYFEQCWKEYGRKGNKAEAYKVWLKLSEEDRLKVLPHVKAYIQSRSDKSYQKDFERYLNKMVFDNVVYKGNMIIFDPERENSTYNEYRPQLDGFNLHWNEQAKCYISMYDIDMLFDGYNADNRPSSAMVMKNGVRYKWNTQTKKWEVQ